MVNHPAVGLTIQGLHDEGIYFWTSTYWVLARVGIGVGECHFPAGMVLSICEKDALLIGGGTMFVCFRQPDSKAKCVFNASKGFNAPINKRNRMNRFTE